MGGAGIFPFHATQRFITVKTTLLVLCFFLVGSALVKAQQVDTLALTHVSLKRNIPYIANGLPRQNLDLYIPQGIKAPMPLIIWIHGGGWNGGYKDWIEVPYLTAQGYVIASIEYRLSQDSIFPAQIKDCNEAIYFLWQHAAEYGLDTSRFVLAGGSAGGHLACLIGTSANNHVAAFYNNMAKENIIHFNAVLNFYGPTDLNSVHGKAVLLDHDGPTSVFTQLLGASILDRPDLAKIASPVTYIDKDDPPFLILHGDADEFVPFFESQAFYSWLTLAGVKATLIKFPGINHAGPEFHNADTQVKVIAFLNEVMK